MTYFQAGRFKGDLHWHYRKYLITYRHKFTIAGPQINLRYICIANMAGQFDEVHHVNYTVIFC